MVTLLLQPLLLLALHIISQGKLIPCVRGHALCAKSAHGSKRRQIPDLLMPQRAVSSHSLCAPDRLLGMRHPHTTLGCFTSRAMHVLCCAHSFYDAAGAARMGCVVATCRMGTLRRSHITIS